jgi:hypothetical protein
MPIFAIALSIVFLLVPSAHAKSKQQVPDDVLKAHLIKIVVVSDFHEKLQDPKDEQQIRDAVEAAFVKWGRFSVVEGKADLVIVAREGHVEPPKLTVPSSNPKSPIAPNGNPPLDPNSPGLATNRVEAEQTIRDIRAEEDSLEVYRGDVGEPLSIAPVWQYRARLGLKGPKVPAVEHFRKAIEKSEKAHSQKD